MSDDPQMNDPRSENPKVADLSAKRERAREAEDLLDDKGVFMGAVKAVRIKWFGELMDTRDRDLKDELVAQLRALDAIPEALQTTINDYKMALDRQRKHG